MRQLKSILFKTICGRVKENYFEFFYDCQYSYDLRLEVFNEKKISCKTESFCENEAIYCLSSIKDNVFSFSQNVYHHGDFLQNILR